MLWVEFSSREYIALNEDINRDLAKLTKKKVNSSVVSQTICLHPLREPTSTHKSTNTHAHIASDIACARETHIVVG